jgi:hypothetical protein
MHRVRGGDRPTPLQDKMIAAVAASTAAATGLTCCFVHQHQQHQQEEEQQQRASLPGASVGAARGSDPHGVLLEEIKELRKDTSSMLQEMLSRLAAAPDSQQGSADAVALEGWCLKQSQEIPLVDHAPPQVKLDPEALERHDSKFPILGRLDHFAVDTSNHLLFLACLGSNCVLVIDTFAGKVVDTLAGRHCLPDYPYWEGPAVDTPQGLLYVAETEHLYVASASGSVHVYFTRDRAFSLLGVIELDGEVDNLRYFDGHVLVGYGNGAIGRIVDTPGLESWDGKARESDATCGNTDPAGAGEARESDATSGNADPTGAGEDADRSWKKSHDDFKAQLRAQSQRRQQEIELALDRRRAIQANLEDRLDTSKTYVVDEHPEGFQIEQTPNLGRERRIFVNVADTSQVQVLGYDSGETLGRWQLPEPLDSNYPMLLDEDNELLLLGVRKPTASSCVLALVSCTRALLLKILLHPVL